MVCSGVDFHDIVYDDERNSVAVRMTVYIRPWLQLWRTTPLQLFALLELEDVIVVSTGTLNSNLALKPQICHIGTFRSVTSFQCASKI